MLRQLTIPDQPLPGDPQTVQRTVLCMGRKQEAVENVPVGNTVRILGSHMLELPTSPCRSCASVLDLACLPCK